MRQNQYAFLLLLKAVVIKKILETYLFRSSKWLSEGEHFFFPLLIVKEYPRGRSI